MECLNFDLDSVTTPDGRFYKIPNGDVYPSVTTVLSGYNKESLDAWRKRVGEEEANKISKKASKKGTKLHLACENYILGKLTPLHIQFMMPDIKELFLQLRPYLDNNVGDVYGIEQPLYSEKLRLAGRCDCIAEWDGELAIIDYKTSSKEKLEENITNYFMQGSAYSQMFKEITGLTVNKIVIAIAVSEGNSQIFVKEKDKYMPQLLEQIQKHRGC